MPHVRRNSCDHDASKGDGAPSGSTCNQELTLMCAKLLSLPSCATMQYNWVGLDSLGRAANQGRGAYQSEDTAAIGRECSSQPVLLLGPAHQKQLHLAQLQ
jgi:hypothetical protein